MTHELHTTKHHSCHREQTATKRRTSNRRTRRCARAKHMNAEIDRAMTLAIAELRRHGGTEAEVEALRQQFRALADDEDSTGKPIQN